MKDLGAGARSRSWEPELGARSREPGAGSWEPEPGASSWEPAPEPAKWEPEPEPDFGRLHIPGNYLVLVMCFTQGFICFIYLIFLLSSPM